MKRTLMLLYGLVCYAMFLGVFVYSVGFIGNLGVSRSLDSGTSGYPLSAIAGNLMLLTVFALQHSIMARPAFKAWWTRFVPAPIERSTYVLFSNVAMVLFFCYWQPFGSVLWDLQSPMARNFVFGIYLLGWGIVFISTCLISHFDLFGLRQVWLNFRRQEYKQLPFTTPGFYQYVRHPLYVGWIIVFWAAPTMTTAHFLFAFATTAYILIAVQFEERDLANRLVGYAAYQNRVPMLMPRMVARFTEQPSVVSREA